MRRRPYEYYIDLVTKRYFHAVDNFDTPKVLDCFHKDATLTEVTTMTTHQGRDTGIRMMFMRLFQAQSRIWHGNFVHTCDEADESICSQFSVEVTPRGTSSPLRYENANRFYLQDGKFTEVFVYMSGENLLR